MTSYDPTRFAGLFPACPTLLTEDETLDAEAQRRLFGSLADNGATGLWMFGSGGEGLTLDDETRRATLELAFDELGADFPVLAGISAEGTKRSVARYTPIADLPISGVFATPPIYYGYSQDELVAYFEQLVAATGQPVFPYHNPFFTKNRLSLDTMVRLAETDGIAGTKDSTKDIAETQQLQWRTPDDFVIFQGHEELVAVSAAIGVRSVVSVVSAAATRLFADTLAAGVDGDLKRSLSLQQEICDLLVDIGTADAANEGEFIGAVKKRLSEQGFGQPILTGPWFGPGSR